MPARRTLLRSLAVAAVVGLLAACGDPTGPAQLAPSAASLGVLRPGTTETAPPPDARRGIWQSGSTETSPTPATAQGIWQSGST